MSRASGTFAPRTLSHTQNSVYSNAPAYSMGKSGLAGRSGQGAVAGNAGGGHSPTPGVGEYAGESG